MGLLTVGYWPTTYWPEDYWTNDYWPVFGDIPYPLNIVITELLEFGISIVDVKSLPIALYPELELFPAATLYPFNGLNLTIRESLEYSIIVTTTGGS